MSIFNTSICEIEEKVCAGNRNLNKHFFVAFGGQPLYDFVQKFCSAKVLWVYFLPIFPLKLGAKLKPKINIYGWKKKSFIVFLFKDNHASFRKEIDTLQRSL